MKKIIFTLFSIVYTSIGLAQNQFDPHNPEHLKEAGKLFVVQVVPGKKETSFWIAGKQAAAIEFNKLRIEAVLYIGKQQKRIELFKRNDHFVTNAPLSGDELRLKLQGEKPEQLEQIRIQLKRP